MEFDFSSCKSYLKPQGPAASGISGEGVAWPWAGGSASCSYPDTALDERSTPWNATCSRGPRTPACRVPSGSPEQQLAPACPGAAPSAVLCSAGLAVCGLGLASGHARPSRSLPFPHLILIDHVDAFLPRPYPRLCLSGYMGLQVWDTLGRGGWGEDRGEVWV